MAHCGSLRSQQRTPSRSVVREPKGFGFACAQASKYCLLHRRFRVVRVGQGVVSVPATACYARCLQVIQGGVCLYHQVAVLHFATLHATEVWG